MFFHIWQLIISKKCIFLCVTDMCMNIHVYVYKHVYVF